MDFDRGNQWWNPSSSSVHHDAHLVAEANSDAKSSIASTQRKRGTDRKINRRISEGRDPNKKSTRSSAGNPEMAVAATTLDFSASHVFPPWRDQSNAYCDIQNAARYFSCSSSSSGTTSQFPAEKALVEKVSNASMMDLWGNINVSCDDHHASFGFVDEEAVFNMPGLVNSMAEGMLLTPPAMKSGFKWDDIDEVDYIYFDLWDNKS
ncbi:ethylene-responsive transcription factor ERF026-like [Henckelia pumila]|uniref:ethylene-responsive transcription factor ERF026-like n=1 Tax=Henckelia pumila TaxID=405737 RepID=UPI003C6E33EA